MAKLTFSVSEVEGDSTRRARVLGRRVAEADSADQRVGQRRSGHFDIWLVAGEATTVFRCRADNVSARGVHAIVPLRCGFRLGQRYRLLICPASPWSGFGSGARLLGYATVVRIEPPADDEAGCLGVGLMFDAPVDWPVPPR